MATEAAPAPPVDSEPVLESAGGRRFRIAEYAGFVPALILYGVFFAVPLGIVVAYSFWKVVDYNVVHDWTVDNYRYFFSVATYVRTLWATVWVSVLSTLLTIAVAFPFAAPGSYRALVLWAFAPLMPIGAVGRFLYVYRRGAIPRRQQLL